MNDLGPIASPYGYPRITVLTYEVASGTGGGATTTGAWNTRPLNTQYGKTDFCTAPSSNRFTLQPGTYLIDAKFSCYDCSTSRQRLANITDTSYPIYSIFATFNNAYTVSGIQSLTGIITITAAKTFEFQHRATTAAAGMGNASSFSVTEVYSQVIITKLA